MVYSITNTDETKIVSETLFMSAVAKNNNLLSLTTPSLIVFFMTVGSLKLINATITTYLRQLNLLYNLLLIIVLKLMSVWEAL